MTPKPKAVKKPIKKKSKGGRPTSYKPEYCKSIVEYFDVKPYTIKEVATGYSDSKGAKQESKLRPADFPTIEGYAHSIGVWKDTIVNWTKKNPEFLSAYRKSKELQKKILITNGMNGTYKEGFAKFVGINLFDDLTDKSVVKNEETIEGGISKEQMAKLLDRLAIDKG